MAEDITPIVDELGEFFNTYYSGKVKELSDNYPSMRSLEVAYADLEKFSPELADELVESPDSIVAAAEQALWKMPLQIVADMAFEPHVRFFGLPASTSVMVESIGAAHIGKLISVDCMVTKRSEIKPKVKVAVLRCRLCDAQFKIPIDKNTTVLPETCDSCKRRALFQDEEASVYVDLQRAEAQEPLEHLRGGAPATHIEMWIEDDLVNTFYPGQRLLLTGVLRILPFSPPRGKPANKLIYSKHLEVMHIQKVEKEFEEVDILPEDLRKIQELSRDPAVYDKIRRSIAPSIYGHDEVKEALALQLFGGTPEKRTVDGGRIRNDIHVLLIGDPGAAKCVSGDTRVLLADGSMKPIKEIVEEVHSAKGAVKVDDGFYAHSNHDLLSIGLDARVCGAKATTFWKLEAPEYVYEVETASGRRVAVTAEHPFFTAAGGRISGVKAEDLPVGAFIATPAFLPFDGAPQRLPGHRKGKTNASHVELPEFVTPEFAGMAGFLAGDGYVRKTASSYEISFINADGALISAFCGAAEKSCGLKPLVSADSRKPHLAAARIFSVELGEVLEAMGLVAGSWEKRVPDEVMRSPAPVARAFLKSYFDCEAHVSKRCPEVTVTSASRELLEQVRVLLLRFGICPSLHEFKSRATNSSQKKTAYCRLSARGEDAARFAREIGFNSAAKSGALEGRLKGWKFNTNVHVVPGVSGTLKSLRGALRLRQTECGVPRPAYLHYELGDRNPSREALERMLSAFNSRKAFLGSALAELEGGEISPASLKRLRGGLWLSQAGLANSAGVSQALISAFELGKCGISAGSRKKIAAALAVAARIPESAEESLILLSELSRSNVFFDKVKSKRKVRPEGEWVYDLTVDGLHNFVANSVFVHNTRFLQFVTRLAPKSVYVSGKSVSAAGLTAAAEKDDLAEGGWTLKAGALVLASNGIAGVDEFDKIDDADRASMHEVMESGTVSVAKAGIVATFNAKTSILAAANPKYGRFDPNMYPAQQFDILPTLLSRFDLIFPIRDVLDEEKDKRTADHILQQHMLGGQRVPAEAAGRTLIDMQPPVDLELLRKYIAYARKCVQPVLTPEASDKLKDYYVELRKLGAQAGAVPITARYLDGLARLCEASAKTRLSQRVEALDAQRAIALVDFVLRATMMDKATGRLDVDIIATGQPKSRVDKIRSVLDIVRKLEKEFDLVEIRQVVEEAQAFGIDEDSARQIVDELLRKAGELYEPKHGFVKIVRPKTD